jgi:hypothetical protein
MSETRQMVECIEGCGAAFYWVEARGERAPYCLDCADLMFGGRREVWQDGVSPEVDSQGLTES